MRKIVLFLILAVIILLAACENKTDVTQQQNAQPRIKEEAQQGAEEGTQAQGLKEILANQKVKYTADYTITAKGNTINTRYIMDLPKFSMETKIEEGETKSIYDGSLFIVCNKAQTGWQCYKMPVQNPESLETEKGINDGTIKTVYLGPCSAAGEQGLKYEMTTNNAKSTVCYTNDGILLELTTPETSMVATKITRTVAANAFVAPAEPVNIPSMLY